MAAKKKEPVTPATLQSIRESLSKVDAARNVTDLSPEERKILELSAVALREAERECIARLEKNVLDALTQSIEPLKQKGREIRARVTRMGKVPKALDKIEDVLEAVIPVLKGVAKW